jgi:ABC-type phosphate transport system auxiliary subunit
MSRPRRTFVADVSTLKSIRDQIELLSERRREVFEQLSNGRTAELVDELKSLDARIAALWDEQRALRAQLRFGDRSRIVARARMEERLERAA